jgi:two-component system KDP operon response regulator KdpE
MHKILIVDDEPTLRNLLERALCCDYEIATASNIEEAADMAAKAPPSLILLDIGMPGGSGLELLARFRSKGMNPCVIMLTSSNELNIAEAALKLGACEYITKPFNLCHLREVIASRIKLQREGPQQENQAPWAVVEQPCKTDEGGTE